MQQELMLIQHPCHFNFSLTQVVCLFYILVKSHLSSPEPKANGLLQSSASKVSNIKNSTKKTLATGTFVSPSLAGQLLVGTSGSSTKLLADQCNDFCCYCTVHYHWAISCSKIRARSIRLQMLVDSLPKKTGQPTGDSCTPLIPFLIFFSKSCHCMHQDTNVVHLNPFSSLFC